ncbi:MAG: nucleoside phosphorylase [Thermomicrobiales bacterium]
MGAETIGKLEFQALVRDDFLEPSTFQPTNLLREARRQRQLPPGHVPSCCVLDPDGDIVRYLRRSDRATRSPYWACYHTDLYETEVDGVRIGVVGCAVGAPFAVLVAEQLFVSGCELLISMTSAGQVAPDLPLPTLVLIDRAIRGEGTSLGYLPPANAVDADPALVQTVTQSLERSGIPFQSGATWTTDSPYRETSSFLASARDTGALAVEMEASALYAFAQARQQPVICFAYITNQMATIEGDFEKGPEDGAEFALRVALATALGWSSTALLPDTERGHDDE